MVQGILLSWLATDHDPFYSEKERYGRLTEEGGAVPGPTLRLLADHVWGPRFQRHVIFHQTEHEAQAQALATAARMRRPDLEVEPCDVGSSIPTNHAEIIKHLTPRLSDLLDRYPYGDHEYFICISPGTPAMHAVWLILVQAEVIRATLIQTVPAKFLQPGESCVRPVSLNLAQHLPPPVFQRMKQSTIEEHEASKRRSPAERLASFMRANVYGPSDTYGVYLLTHRASSPEQIDLCLKGVGQAFEQVRDILSAEAADQLQTFLDDAWAAFSEGFEKFKEWSDANREELKRAFRFNFQEWLDELKADRPGGLNVECDVAEGVRFLVKQDVYCDEKLVRRGLDGLVDNIVSRAYPEGSEGRCSMRVTVRKEGEARDIVLVVADGGVGIADPAATFDKMGGGAGGVAKEVREMARWFHTAIVESTRRVRYDIKEAREEVRLGDGTGTVYTLTFRTARSLDSK